MTIVPVGSVPRPRRPHRPGPSTAPRPPADTARAWLVTAVLTFIGGVVRFWQLGFRTDGGTPLFDEKYYAVQAAEMIRTGGMDDNQAYGVIVHPPLGKQIIALGELLFGYNPIGWRFASAVAGTIAIAVIIRAARRLTGSTLLGAVAGVLLICDGVSHVMARTALLDSIQVVFVLGAFAALLADRDQVRARIAAATFEVTVPPPPGGVVLGARWWRLAAGVLLGCATAVKWSGAYWVAAFAVLCVLWDVSARRQAGQRRPVAVTLRRDLLPSAWALGVVPVATYIASYWAWFSSETAWGRHDGGTGMWGAIKGLALMTVAMLKTTAGIVTDPDSPHPWESKPWAWPLSARPVLYYLAGGEGTEGCGAERADCVKRILLVGTPALWWVSLAVLAWALWKAVGRLDWRYAAVLVGYGAGYLPWFLILDRQMYFFYMAPVAPFLVLGIVLVAGDILGPAPARETSYVSSYISSFRRGLRGDDTGKDTVRRRLVDDPRLLRLALVAGYVGLVVANFAWLWPILVGDPITPERLRWETWLPSWG